MGPYDQNLRGCYLRPDLSQVFTGEKDHDLPSSRALFLFCKSYYPVHANPILQ